MEIFYNGAWGTVCDDSWDLRDARVVCRELGYPSASSAPQAAHFGAGRGQILLDDVHCLGNESSIRNCRHRGWTSHNCNHREDASVICFRTRKYKYTRTRLLESYCLHCRFIVCVKASKLNFVII